MFWTTGLILALALSQVPAEIVVPEFVENINYDATQSDSRIVSGWSAVPGQIPYQVSLRLVNKVGGVSGCGGSVVSREWVISAAHCTSPEIYTVVVRAGLVDLRTPEYILETNTFYNHPTYNEELIGVVQPNDISIVKLAKPVTYSKNLRPIRIQSSANAFFNYDREIVEASGFGRTWTNSATSETLNFVYLRAVSNQVCALNYGTLITANSICARSYNVTSQSTCQGDSGGPLTHYEDGFPVLVGVASFVAGGQYGCHSGLPAGFTRPGPFLSWFEKITGIDFENWEEIDNTTPKPEETTPDPEETTPEPEETTPEPEETTPEPEESTPEPEESTPEPEESTPEPEESTPEPEETTPEPEESTPEPEESTPEPEESTPEPEETTPEPEEESEENPDLVQQLLIKVNVNVEINNTPKKNVTIKCINHE